MSETFVVIGGGTGMGREVALRLAADGARVVISGRRRERLQAVADEAPGGAIAIAVGDAATADGVARLRDVVEGQELAGIVAAAGGQGDFFHGDADPESVRERWAAAMDLNLYTALLPIEALAASLQDGRGRVVVIGSTAGLDGQGGPYATAKAALHGYARDLAQRLGSRGITANAVAPGFVAETGFFEAGGFGSADPMVEGAAARTLVGRVGLPADIAATVLHLLDNDAGWITGQVISPNGGTNLVQ